MWSFLQRNHFQTHQMYEFKLHGEHRIMDQAGGNLPNLNVTIPFILPIIQLYHRDLDLLSNDLDPAAPGFQLSWEHGEDCGLQTLFSHLEAARVITSQYGGYRSAAENMMRDFQCNEDVMDMLRTELHLRLLFGMKGSKVVSREEYNKFEQVLQAFSVKMEPKDNVLQRETSL